MKSDNKFPDWIVNSVLESNNQLNPKSKEFFEKIVENLPHFYLNFINIPDTSDIGILKNYDPVEVKNQYGFKSPFEFILLNIFEQFHFQAIYQLRELGISLFTALSEGRFFVAALLNRAMLEVVSVNYYTLIKIENKFNENLKYLNSSAKTKSSDERIKLLNIYYQSSYDIFSKLFDANTATSIDWQMHLHDKFGISIPKSDKRKTIHVHDGIKDLSKASGLPLWEVYATLSEFVHPNAGSKMLIINTKRENDPFMDAVTLGDNKSNPEAALFYVDNIAEGMFYTISLALTLNEKGQKLISLLDLMSTGEESKILH
jgi:hypothetical protein